MGFDLNAFIYTFINGLYRDTLDLEKEYIARYITFTVNIGKPKCKVILFHFHSVIHSLHFIHVEQMKKKLSKLYMHCYCIQIENDTTNLSNRILHMEFHDFL